MKTLSAEEMTAIASQVIEMESAAVLSLKGQFTSQITQVAQMLFECRGHILVAGAGTSRAVAQRFAHLLACCGSPGLFISAADAIHGGAGAVGEKDVVYIISKGGQSAEINRFAQIVKDRGAKVIAHTEKPDSPLGALSDAVYRIVAPADVDPYGMIATGSSLVNAAACDVLCTLLLRMRGYTKEQFGHTHPGGAVGRKLEQESKTA
ncbi:MAG: SIS domain-containing protein [Phycisphaerae bacterium]|nr:SIS domain-containing protein [Phycisphaerae bacterium]